MEFIKEFEKNKNPVQRLEESKRLRAKHFDRVPIVVDRANRHAPKMQKCKFLCPVDLTFGQFMAVVRKRLANEHKMQPDQALFFFLAKKNVLVPTSALISQLFQEHAEDGFLIVTYALESTFGA